MINYYNENLFRQNSTYKDYFISDNSSINLSNSDIYSECIELNEMLTAEDDLIFGSCIASTLKFTTFDVTDSFAGKYLTLSVVLDEDTDHPFVFGTYRVVEETLTADREKKEIVAKDVMYDINNADVVSWYDSLTFPMTLKNFRDSFFSYMGVAQETTTLVNDSMVIERSIAPYTLLGSEVIRAICEINGVFGHIGRDNEFKYISLNTSPVYSITSSMGIPPVEYEDYVSRKINKVIIRQEDNDLGASYGSGDNVLIVQGNFLVYGIGTADLTPIAQNLYSVASNATYRPCEVKCIGNPCLEVGDVFSVTTNDGTTFNSYVLDRDLTGGQSLIDTITAMGNETRQNDYNSPQNQWIQMLGKSNKLESTLETTISEISDLNTAVTTVTQTASDLTVQVQNLQEQIDGETGYYERYGEPTLLNYPYWDYTTSFKCDGTKKCAPLYNDDMSEGGNQYPHFYYSEQDRKDHMRDLCIDLDNGNGYRFVLENNTWYWKQIADSDFSILFNQITTLRQTVEGIEGTVSDVEIEVNDHESRITTNESNISQQATQISAKVNQTDHNQQNTFGWTLNTSGFDIRANNQSVLLVNSSGAEIKGKITAYQGYIGNGSSGFEIGNTSIKNGMTSLADTTHNGIYVGTDGIALGKGAFKVTNAGALTAKSGNIGNFGIGAGLQYLEGGTEVCSIKPTTSGSMAGLDISGQNIEVGATRVVRIEGGWNVVVKTEDFNFLDGDGAVRWYSDTSRIYSFVPIYAPSFNQTSDRKFKTDIKELDSDEARDFIMNLKPCEFMMNETKHHGFIAQEVKESMYDDWDLHKTVDETQFLAYTELIADMISTIQKQQEEINELKRLVKGE